VLSKLAKRAFPGLRVASVGSPEEAAAFARAASEEVAS